MVPFAISFNPLITDELYAKQVPVLWQIVTAFVDPEQLPELVQPLFPPLHVLEFSQEVLVPPRFKPPLIEPNPPETVPSVFSFNFFIKD